MGVSLHSQGGEVHVRWPFHALSFASPAESTHEDAIAARHALEGPLRARKMATAFSLLPMQAEAMPAQRLKAFMPMPPSIYRPSRYAGALLLPSGQLELEARPFSRLVACRIRVEKATKEGRIG